MTHKKSLKHIDKKIILEEVECILYLMKESPLWYKNMCLYDLIYTQRPPLPLDEEDIKQKRIYPRRRHKRTVYKGIMHLLRKLK